MVKQVIYFGTEEVNFMYYYKLYKTIYNKTIYKNTIFIGEKFSMRATKTVIYFKKNYKIKNNLFFFFDKLNNHFLKTGKYQISHSQSLR
jgi:hypothetical protein